MELQENTAQNTLRIAWRQWDRMRIIRANRLRNKDFSFGRQLNDYSESQEGIPMSDYEVMRKNGIEPLTNNLIRQLVKTVLGRYITHRKEQRNAQAKSLRGKKYMSDAQAWQENVREENGLDELDVRMLEEFLLSGCAVQRIGFKIGSTKEVVVENVNPAFFFTDMYEDSHGRDCKMVGMLHSMTLAEVLLRFADGDSRKEKQLMEAYSASSLRERTHNVQMLLADGAHQLDSYFWHAQEGRVRLIEVWTQQIRKVDDEQGWHYEKFWHCRWLSPTATVISEYDSPYPHGEHPFVMKMYPLIDGEVHALVEDVIDQQKFVNRLISTIDYSMIMSAKGVLVYPAKSLPEGYTWDMVRSLWRTPGSIIPYSDKDGGTLPIQISTNATDIGAHELLKVEMDMFQQVSGVSDALRGGMNASGTRGAELYRQQTENATIAIMDIFATYDNYIIHRDKKILSLRS